jgi:acyl-CoA dehydrogenase
MATHLDAEQIELQKNIDRFAVTEMLKIPDLGKTDDFPLSLWRKMGEQKLLGIGIPDVYGGSGGSWLSLQAAGEALVRGGRNLGMALSWMIHAVVSRFAVLGFGNAQQRDRWLPQLASGETTISLAISEPGTGAHPKHMRATAERRGDEWILTGEKTFLTNGPLAGLFVLLAVTGRAEAVRPITAFLLPRPTPGLELTETIRLGALKPSLHCGIRMDGCVVTGRDILGEPGTAFERISKPFREIEDVLLMGPAAGGMSVQLAAIAAGMRDTVQTDALKTDLGSLLAQWDALRILAYEAAVMLDSGRSHAEFQSILLSFRRLARQFQSDAARLKEQTGPNTDETLHLLTRDIDMLLGVAQQVALIKQKKMGERLLSGKDHHHAGYN